MKAKVINLNAKTVSNKISNHTMNGYLNLGEKFTVYAITIMEDVTYLQIYLNNNLISVPSDLFEIIDSKVSKYWKFKKEDDSISFWPEEFYDDYFHDDLLEEIPERVKQFADIKKRIDNE